MPVALKVMHWVVVLMCRDIVTINWMLLILVKLLLHPLVNIN